MQQIYSRTPLTKQMISCKLAAYFLNICGPLLLKPFFTFKYLQVKTLTFIKTILTFRKFEESSIIKWTLIRICLYVLENKHRGRCHTNFPVSSSLMAKVNQRNQLLLPALHLTYTEKASLNRDKGEKSLTIVACQMRQRSYTCL